ncbi:MAG: YggU family protein [Rhodocyclaceae bacterium]|jgi:uncharacterized protein (TIGR00251 family)|nr:YggU family protein [Rhodocyclaceae bacterium]
MACLSDAYLCTKGDGTLQLTVHVQPGAKTTSCAGIHGDALKIRLAAPPVDGKANQALIVWLAKTLGCPQNRIELIRGQTSRRKTLSIDPGAKADSITTQLTQMATITD